VIDGQINASRWRAICTKHFREDFKKEYGELMGHTETKVIVAIARILQLAGARGHPDEIKNDLINAAKRDLEQLLNLADCLSEKVKEQVTLRDYQLLYSSPEADFDGRSERDYWDLPEKKITRNDLPKVFCTAQVGLACLANPGERDERLRWEIVEKAAVVLETDVDALCL
jgi:hypothetical protein